MTGFYTPQPIVSAIHDGLKEYGIIPGRFIDPSAGTGRFAEAFANPSGTDEIVCFEKDMLTGQVLQSLHPSFQVFKEGFENIEKPFDHHFDMVASNIPFGNMQISDPVYLREKKESVKRRSLGSLHNYFFVKGLDVLREGGVLAYIASRGVMDRPRNDYVRRYLVENANLVTAIRLPDNTFTDSTGTEAGTDLIVLQKQTGKTELSERERLFIETRQLLTVEDISVNRFYTNPGEDHGLNRIVKTDMKIGTDQYGKPGIEYTHEGGVEGIATELKRMLSNDVKFYINNELYASNRIIPSKKT